MEMEEGMVPISATSNGDIEGKVRRLASQLFYVSWFKTMVALRCLSSPILVHGFLPCLTVIPAKAGIHDLPKSLVLRWIPAFAGMTNWFFYKLRALNSTPKYATY